MENVENNIREDGHLSPQVKCLIRFDFCLLKDHQQLEFVGNRV